MIELELAGVPTAYVGVKGKVPLVRRSGRSFELQHGFGYAYAVSGRFHDDLLEEMGVHRAMRLAGCREGDPVRVGDKEVSWSYPPNGPDQRPLPGGLAKWYSRADGIRAQRFVTTAGPVKDLDGASAKAWAAEVAPKLVALLQGT